MQNKEEYLDSVCSQIRFKSARRYLRRELAAHIDDKKETLKQNEVPDAETAAVEAMGDPAETGRALNAVHRPRTAWGVIVCMLLLSVIGTVLFAVTRTNDIYFSGMSFARQLTTVIIGLCAMAGMYFFDYTLLVRFRYVFYMAGMLYIVGFMLYSEITKYLFEPLWLTQNPVIVLSMLLFIPAIIGFADNANHKGLPGLIGIGVLSAVSVAAMMLIPASLYALILAIVCISILAVAASQKHSPGAQIWRHLLVAVGIVSAVFVLMMFLPQSRFGFGANIGSSYNSAVVPDMLHGAQCIGPSEYYVSDLTWYLHGSDNVYILTTIISAYGWLCGGGIVLILIAMFTFMIIRSTHITDPLGRMLAIGITVFLLVKFLICLLTNVGLLGGAECNMPFISNGRLDYIANALLVGLFLSVWRRSAFMKKDTITRFRYTAKEKNISYES